METHRKGGWCIRLGFPFVLSLILANGATLSGQGEAYYFATAGIDAGPESFVDKWCGPDMLPYTQDDIDLPERGNIGGTLGFSWIDSDGDGQLSAEERIFAVIRRGDDDTHTFSTKSYPQYGVLAESENWIDYHEARNRGPSATKLGDPEIEGDDFEHNDRAGSGEAGWEDASNYYWYNNSRADQWGWGGSRYYFEQRNGEGLDEIEGFNKWLSFSTNMDDPTTLAMVEDGLCSDSYIRSPDAVTKGLLIPIEGIPGLEDGDLDPLFGWYTGDMARYVREVLGPKLEDPNLQVFENSEACAQSGLPPTHVMILQIECPIAINASGDCPDQTAAEAQAAYWGITPIVPGDPETDAVYRVSHVLLFNDELTAVAAGVPSFATQPDDGVERNLWVQDDFWRANSAKIGKYVLGGSWSIQDDSSFDHGCGEQDKYFQLPAGSSGFFEAPLSASLDPSGEDIVVVAELGQLDTAGGGGQAPLDPQTVYQLILLDGANVIAYAEFSSDASSVNVGGELTVDGLAASPTGTQAGSAGEVPLLDPQATEFTRFVMKAGPGGIRLSQALFDDYTSNDYASLDGYDVLASSTTGIPAGAVTAVRLATSGDLGTLAIVVDGFAVFSSPSAAQKGDFVRGNTNNDAKVDISDGIFLLNHLFLGGSRWVCDESADANDSGKTDLSDAVYLFNFLFLGGPTLKPPYPDCGADPNGEKCPQSSCNAG